MRSFLNLFKKYIKVTKKITQETFATVSDIDESGNLADIIASHLPLKIKDKQKLLEITNVKDRLQQLIKLISNEKKVLDLERSEERRVGKECRTQRERDVGK